MTKYRIAIQEIDGKKFKHVHNIMLSSNSLKKVVKKIRKTLSKEIEEQQDKFSKQLSSEFRHQKNRAIISSDLFDKHSVGHDITSEEFLKNEMEWYKHEHHS